MAAEGGGRLLLELFLVAVLGELVELYRDIANDMIGVAARAGDGYADD